MRKYKVGELVYFCYDSFSSYSKVSHAVSTRLGGVSSGVYKSLNLGLHVGDEHSAVIRNRELLCDAVGIDLGSVVAGEQVHGTEIFVATADQKGKGATNWLDGIKCTDALITNVPNLTLLMIAADCVMLSLFDPKRKVISMAHAGWRGTVAKIAQKTVERMVEIFECDPADILTALSPSIGPCCYAVESDIVERFQLAFPYEAPRFLMPQADGSVHLNLWGANSWQLLAKGIKEENIEISNLCTSCNTDIFYSYEAEGGRTGRFGAMLVLN
jgi:YfiH family protein